MLYLLLMVALGLLPKMQIKCAQLQREIKYPSGNKETPNQYSYESMMHHP